VKKLSSGPAATRKEKFVLMAAFSVITAQIEEVGQQSNHILVYVQISNIKTSFVAGGLVAGFYGALFVSAG